MVYTSDGVFAAPIVANGWFANAVPAMRRICVQSFDSVKDIYPQAVLRGQVLFKFSFKE